MIDFEKNERRAIKLLVKILKKEVEVDLIQEITATLHKLVKRKTKKQLNELAYYLKVNSLLYFQELPFEHTSLIHSEYKNHTYDQLMPLMLTGAPNISNEDIPLSYEAYDLVLSGMLLINKGVVK